MRSKKGTERYFSFQTICDLYAQEKMNGRMDAFSMLLVGLFKGQFERKRCGCRGIEKDIALPRDDAYYPIFQTDMQQREFVHEIVGSPFGSVSIYALPADKPPFYGFDRRSLFEYIESGFKLGVYPRDNFRNLKVTFGAQRYYKKITGKELTPYEEIDQEAFAKHERVMAKSEPVHELLQAPKVYRIARVSFFERLMSFFNIGNRVSDERREVVEPNYDEQGLYVSDSDTYQGPFGYNPPTIDEFLWGTLLHFRNFEYWAINFGDSVMQNVAKILKNKAQRKSVKVKKNSKEKAQVDCLYYSRDEVAALVGKSPSTITNWDKRRVGQYARINFPESHMKGRSRVWDKDEIDNWAKEHKPRFC